MDVVGRCPSPLPEGGGEGRSLSCVVWYGWACGVCGWGVRALVTAFVERGPSEQAERDGAGWTALLACKILTSSGRYA